MPDLQIYGAGQPLPIYYEFSCDRLEEAVLTAEDFIKNFDWFFPPSIREIIKIQNFEDFSVNKQGLVLGAGEIVCTRLSAKGSRMGIKEITLVPPKNPLLICLKK